MGFPGTSDGSGTSAPELDTGNAGATKTIDWTASRNQAVTLTTDTIFSFIPPSISGSDLTLRMKFSGIPPTAIYFPSRCRWPGGLTPVFDFSDPDNSQLVRIYFDGADYHCRIVSGLKKLPVQMNLAGYNENQTAYGYPGIALNVGGGPNRVAFLVFGEMANTFYGPIGSVTFAGQPMTRLVPPSEDYRGLQVYYRINPPVGVQFCTFNGFSNTSYLIQVFVLTGIDQANPIDSDDSRSVFDDYSNPFYIGTIPPSSNPNQFLLSICSSFNGAYGGPYNPTDPQSVKIFEQALPNPEQFRRQICALLGPINPPGYRQTTWQGSAGFGTRIERRILLNPA